MKAETAVEQAPKLLVIDDDKGITDLFRLIAEELMFDYYCVHEFEEISQAYKSISPDVIFLDLKLPGHDGVEALGLLAELGCKSKIYIVSGLDKTTLESAGELGRLDNLNIQGTLKKPFLIEDVESMLIEESDSSSSFTSDSLQDLFGPGEFRIYYQPCLKLQDTGNTELRDLEIKTLWATREEESAIPDWIISRKLESDDRAAELSKEILAKALHAHAPLSKDDAYGYFYAPHSKLFSDVSFPGFLSRLLDENGLRADQLTLGIHETNILRDSQEILNIVTRLRINGFNISVEITNADTVELDLLLHLPVNELRLCADLTATITKSVDAEFEISTLIAACNKRDVLTRADGVDNEKLLSFLTNCGCTSAQGMLLSHPLKLQQIANYILNLSESKSILE